MRGLIQSFRYALEGMAYALLTQRNMRIHFTAGMLVILLCAILQVNTYEIIAVLFSVALVITLELANTAVERVIDLLVEERRHPYAKIAKDVAAAAVFIASINALFIAYFIFYDKLFPIKFRNWSASFRPPYIGAFLIALLIFFILVVAYAVMIKNNRKEKVTRGS